MLIDGRYRVACFLATCIYAKKETIVLFDDYEQRKQYHTVEKLFEKVDVIDDRMAVFVFYQTNCQAEHCLTGYIFSMTFDKYCLQIDV